MKRDLWIPQRKVIGSSSSGCKVIFSDLAGGGVKYVSHICWQDKTTDDAGDLEIEGLIKKQKRRQRDLLEVRHRRPLPFFQVQREQIKTVPWSTKELGSKSLVQRILIVWRSRGVGGGTEGRSHSNEGIHRLLHRSIVQS